MRKCQLKGVVLAGGTGSRLFPLAKVTNRHLLPVNDKLRIYSPIQAVVNPGINAILLVSGGTGFKDICGSSISKDESITLCMLPLWARRMALTCS